jgi:putative tricarboxylic transport membrane protein
MKRLLALALAFVATTAYGAEGWKPTRPVALIAPNAPGGNSDRVAREMERVLRSNRLVDVPIVVVNRAGGAGTIALNQLVASPGDAHVLLIGTPGLLSNHITGLTQHHHSEFTHLALLLEDYYGVNVRTASPLQSAREIVDLLRKTPDALAIGTSGLTGSNFTSLLMGFKRGGVDVKKLKIVSFAGGGQSTMALLGGHIDVVSTGLSNMAEHLQQGKMRLLVISSPTRRDGIFAGVPTWKEIGIDMTASTWRTVTAPKGLRPQQIAYWDGVFRRLSQTDEWKKDVADNHWENTYLPAPEARKRLDRDYAETKQILADLGMAK